MPSESCEFCTAVEDDPYDEDGPDDALSVDGKGNPMSIADAVLALTDAVRDGVASAVLEVNFISRGKDMARDKERFL